MQKKGSYTHSCIKHLYTKAYLSLCGPILFNFYPQYSRTKKQLGFNHTSFEHAKSFSTMLEREEERDRDKEERERENERVWKVSSIIVKCHIIENLFAFILQIWLFMTFPRVVTHLICCIMYKRIWHVINKKESAGCWQKKLFFLVLTSLVLCCMLYPWWGGNELPSVLAYVNLGNGVGFWICLLSLSESTSV